jgi:phosphoribosylformimino-5-aminoimidazole carboxamide ribotide isomerase
MDILPAIDLIQGKCVRLIQGEYDKQITYKDDPVAQAAEFRQAGSDWLHIIDLEGAKAGKPVNVQSIKAIADSGLGLKIEVGGGIRDEQAISDMIDIGIDRLIIGTRAVTEFDWFSKMAAKFPYKLALGLDARGSKISVDGWTKEGQLDLWDFAAQAARLPIAAIIYTDITKDGMLAGPNIERTQALVDAVEIPVIAAGGVTTTEDIVKLKQAHVAGVIIGRALYEGSIELKDAIEAERSA